MDKLSIIYLLQLALKRIWALILACVIFAGSAFAYCKFVAVPVYSASASILVTNGALISTYDPSLVNQKTSVNGTDIAASKALADTVVDILKTSNIYIDLAKETGNRYSYGSLKGMASVSKRNDETLFIDITFNSTDQNDAKELVNKFARISCDYIVDFIPYAKANVAEEADGAGKVSPRTTFITGLAGLAGIVVAYLLVLLIDLLNQSIRGEEEFVARYDIPLIGSVPDFEAAGATYGSTYLYSKGGYPSGKK